MNAFMQIAGWTLVHFVWQGAAIALLAAVGLRLTERRSSNVRYLVACVGLGAMLAAPFATARLLSVAAQTRTLQAGSADLTPPPALTGADAPAAATKPALVDAFALPSPAGLVMPRVSLDRLMPGVVSLWLVGVALLLGRMTGGWWHVRRLHRSALATNASRWQTSCRRIAYRLGLPAAAHVVESTLVDVPTVVGWLRPAILLPVAAISALTPSQVEAILAHELAHIRRHDYAVNLVQTIAETLLFYHPAVWWLSKRVRAEREHCCDEIAVEICGDAVAYAKALAELEAWRTTSYAMAVAATGGSLINRVRRILHVPVTDEPRSPSWVVTLALTMIFTAGAGSIQQLPWLSTRSDARAQSSSELQVAALPPPLLRGGLDIAGDRQLPRPPQLPDRFERPEPPDPPDPPEPPEAPEAPEPPEPPGAVPAQAELPPLPPLPPLPSIVPVPPSPPTPPSPAAAPPAPPAPPAPSAPPPPAPPAPRVPSAAPAPPAAPAAPAAPAPPAPPAPGGFSASSNGDWHMQWSDGSSRFDVRLHGTIAFSDDLTDVTSLSDGGSLTMRDWSSVIPHTIEIRSSGGTITRRYYVGGLTRPWDDEARRRLAEQLPLLVRRSGLGAASRVRSIFARKGVPGVIEEIDLLGGDYARRLYFVALIDIAQLDAATALPVLWKVGQRMTSDYDRAQVLQHLARQVTLDQRASQAYLQAMASMKSDYERRRALTALFASAGAAAQGDAVVSAIDAMTSSYDKRMVLADVISRGSLTPDMKRGVLAAATGVRSDYDCSQILLAYVGKYGVEPAVRDPFFAAVAKISSDYERRRVLSQVAAKGGVAGDVQESAFDVVRTMRSDYDRAEVLLAFLGAKAVDSSARQAFVNAAEHIKSSYDQNRVLAALVKSERR
jgi:beta-lactamase regulating signal transducer with metallopeptidase domain